MEYKYLLFDLDGTLLDTLEDLKDSVNYALERAGCPNGLWRKCRLLWAMV